MHPSSSLPPIRLPPAESRSGNEFSAAVSRLMERRAHASERAVVLPRLDPEEAVEESPARWRLPDSGLGRGLLVALPVAMLGFLSLWLLTGPPPSGMPPPVLPPIKPLPALPGLPRPVVERAPVPPPGPEAMPLPVAPEAAPPSAAPPPPAPSPAVPPPPAAARPTVGPLTREEIREAQGRLSALGFAAGPADGVAGPQTQAALRRYAESRRLPGRELDRPLLERLRAEPPPRR